MDNPLVEVERGREEQQQQQQGGGEASSDGPEEKTHIREEPAPPPQAPQEGVKVRLPFFLPPPSLLRFSREFAIPILDRQR